MIVIIHGEDTTASRQYYLQELKKSSIDTTFDGEVVSLTDLVQLLEGGSFFETTPGVGIENILSKRKPSKEFESVLSFLQNRVNETILLWEPKDVPITKLNLFKKAEIKQFKLPQHLFTFLESLQPVNSKRSIELFHRNLETSEVEILFFMLVRQFRMLLTVSEDSIESIDEIQRIAPWQKNKLLSQSRQFSVKQLITLYNKLYNIELGHKTGTLNMPLVSAIDIFLLEL